MLSVARFKEGMCVGQRIVGIMSASSLHGTEVKLKELILKHYILPQKLEAEKLSVEELNAYKVMG
jgi:hypothetical protein